MDETNIMDAPNVVSAISGAISAIASLVAVAVAAGMHRSARAERQADRDALRRVKRPLIRAALNDLRGDLIQMEHRFAVKNAFDSLGELLGSATVPTQLDHVERLISFESDLNLLPTDAVKVMGAIESARPYGLLLRSLQAGHGLADSVTHPTLMMRVRNLKQAVETALEALHIDLD